MCVVSVDLTSSHPHKSPAEKSPTRALPKPNPLSIYIYINLSDVRMPPRLAALIQLTRAVTDSLSVQRTPNTHTPCK